MRPIGWRYESTRHSLAAKGVKTNYYAKRKWKDELHGGRADKNFPWQFDKVRLAKGIKEEYEHTNSKHLATEIAMDHLAEDPLYYEKLAEMEKKSYAAKKDSLFQLFPKSYARTNDDGYLKGEFKRRSDEMAKKKGFFDKSDVRDEVPKEMWQYKGRSKVLGRRIVENIHDNIEFVERGKRYSVNPDIDPVTDGAVRKYRWVENQFVRSAPLPVLKRHYGSMLGEE